MLSFYRSRVSGRTQEIPAHERRLDSLARLLATPSKHAAACLINRTLYIAAIEFNKEISNDDPIMRSFQEAIDYFTKVARREIIHENERKTLFEKFCTPDRLKGELSRMVEGSVWYGFPGELFKRVIASVFNNEDPRMSEFKKLYGQNEKIALLLHSAASRIKSDFSKLEESIRSNEGQYAELRQALKTGNIQFLKNETATGVHPEVQILSVIVQLISQGKLQKYPPKDKKSYTLYIGNSQLNCLNCDMLIVAARQLFQSTEKVRITTRGNRHVEMEWECPDGFCKERSAYMPNEEWTSFAQMLYENREEYYAKHSPSSSESEEEVASTPAAAVMPLESTLVDSSASGAKRIRLDKQ